MIIVRVDLGPVQGGGIDTQGVALLFDARAAFGEFGFEGVNAFAFLETQAFEVGEQDGLDGKWSDDNGGHDAVAKVAATGDFWRQGKQLGEPFVNLPAGGGPMRDGKTGRPEIAAAGGVGFNAKSATTARKVRDEFGGHGNVRRLLGILASDFDFPSADPGTYQQGGGELGTVLDADAGFADARAGAMDEGGEFVVGGFDLVAELAQGVEERGLGTFVHAGNA